MPDKESNELLGFALRSKEADEAGLKMSWYSHVLNTLEKLDAHVDKLTTEMYKQRDEFRKDLYALREKIRLETADIKDVSVLERHITELIATLDRRVNVLEQTDDVTSIKTDIDLLKDAFKSHKNEWNQELIISNKTLKEEVTKLVDPLSKQVLRVEVKVALWGTLAGMVGSGLVVFLFSLLKGPFGGG